MFIPTRKALTMEKKQNQVDKKILPLDVCQASSEPTPELAQCAHEWNGHVCKDRGHI